MKEAKKWLLLLGTVLVVVGAAVLPQQLSQAKDRSFFDQVNAETATDTLFSPVDDLAFRIQLLARWELAKADTDGSLGFSTEVLPQDLRKANDFSLMTHSIEMEQRVLDALHALAAQVPQIEQLLPQAMSGVQGERKSFYDWDSGEIANFLEFSWVEAPGWQVVVGLDEAMEKVVSLLISGPHLADWGQETRESILLDFLDYLGLSGEDMRVVLDSDSSAAKVPGTDIYYYIYLNRGLISIQPLAVLPEDWTYSESDNGRTRQYQTVKRKGWPITKVIEKG